MRSKSPKEKQGVARLFELAGQRGRKLTLACVLSVLSSAARIVPFFTIYGVVRELLAHYQEPSMVNQNAILSALVACLRQFDLVHQHRQLLQVTATFEWQNGLLKENIRHESYQHWKAV